MALLVSVIEAARAPGAVGVKVALIVQLLPAATGLPQVLLCAKSPGFAPVSVPLAVIFKGALPVLLTVTI